MAFDVKKIRKDFPILHQKIGKHPLIYFDNAATTQKPSIVIETLKKYYEKYNSNVHRGLHSLSSQATEAFENARSCVARFIHAAEPEEIIFTRGTTESINLVASTWGQENIHAGDTILLTEMEHHSNLVPWQILAQRTGAKLKFIPVNTETGLLELDDLPQLLDGAKILSFTHISNTLGTINPVEEICALARKHGVVTLVDAAQSAGHCPLDVQKIGCDFLAFSGHKVCGPTGIGVLYGRREILEKMPPYQGGGEMISSVTYEKSDYKPIPHKFEAGTPDISGAIGLHAALDYLDKIGRKKIAQHDHQLAAYAYKKLVSKIKDIHIIGPKKDRAGLVSFQLGKIHAHDVVTLADQYGIALRGGHHCNQPLMRKFGLTATARASFYFYNTKQEIDDFVEAMLQIQKYFNRGT